MNEFFRLLQFDKNYGSQATRAALFSCLNKTFDIAPEILIGVAIDLVVNRGHPWLQHLGFNDAVSSLWALGGLTLAIWVCESATEYAYSIHWRGLAQTVQHDLRQKAYQKVQQLDLQAIQKTSTGNLVAILNDDINQLERFLDGGANALLQVFTSTVLISACFFFLAPKLAFISLLPIPVIIVGAFYFQRRAQPLYEKVRHLAGALSSRLASNILGMETIKAYNAHASQAKTIQTLSTSYAQANGQAIKVSSAFVPTIRMAVLAGFLATLIYGGHEAINGHIGVGIYGVLVFLTQRLLWPFTTLAQTVDLYQRAMASAARVFQLFDLPEEKSGGSSLKALKNHDLRFHHVSFSYAAGTPILEDVSIDIPAGKTIALVGTTGSGKSTIAKLLLRFLKVDTGHITLGNQNIDELSLTEYRQLMGYVGQDVFISEATIGENIAFGAALDAAAVAKAAEQAAADDFIKRLPQSYESSVGERGYTLSGGQRQRLSLARAIYREPPVLILDEATSAVDSETEKMIQRSLRQLQKKRTVVIIAHRLSTVQHADCIYVLQRGRVVEQGTHAQLLRQHGAYHQLWQAQEG